MGKMHFPDTVYHGTFLSNLDQFRIKPLDRTKWVSRSKSGEVQAKDFGFGLYTSTDFNRISRFIQGKLKRNFRSLDEKPCIVEFQINSRDEYNLDDFVVFTGVSQAWSAFIFDHRTSSEETCAVCEPDHPDTVIGPIADNSFKKLLASVKRKGQAILEKQGQLEASDVKELKEWFHEEIIREKSGRLLTFDELNNQIVFCNDEYPILQIVRYYTLDNGEWVSHDEY